MESGLKEALVQNLNFVSAKRDMEFFNKILLQNKRKGVESDFFGKLLGYEKGINIFLFPTFHDIILIDFSII